MNQSHYLFNRIQVFAQNNPEAIAVMFKNQSLNYKELETQSNQLVHFLRKQGIKKEDRVALSLPRSLDLAVAILGILKSGAVYVPLDPEHPPERRQYICEDAQVKYVLEQNEWQKFLTERVALSPELDQHPSPFDLAYIMYTSGSTGKAKGVLVDHGNLIERFKFAPYQHFLSAGQKLAAITAVSWNPSVYENLYTFVQGAVVVMFDTEEIRDANVLKHLLKVKDIQFIRAVPTLLQALVDAEWEGKNDLVIVSHGDKLSSQLTETLRAKAKSLYNTYGATEATVFTLIELTSDNKKVFSPPNHDQSVGSILVLNDHSEPASIGEIGEICHMGQIVARGYQADPQLTKQKFFMGKDGKTKYFRTGDMARVLSPGHYEFLGRQDSQVKIRGQRIELGEVESIIATHPAVKAVVTNTYLDASGNHQLAAFIVPKTASLDEFILRTYLENKLPSAMIPGIFITLDSIPLNQNQKVDRKLLPDPRSLNRVAEATAVNLSSSEKLIATIFAEVLGRKGVSRDQNFFELGGHSLLAALVCSRIARNLGYPLSLKNFYELGTVGRIAAFLDAGNLKSTSSNSEVIEVETSRVERPLSFSQERLWFMHKLSGDDAGYNITLAMRLKGKLNLLALTKSFQALIDRHEVLRTRFHLDLAGKPVQSVVKLDAFVLKVIKQPDVDKVRSEIMALAAKPFDLAVAPLFTHQLYEISSDEHILFVNFHHIISDGWSKAVFKKELVDHYNALVENKASPLAPLKLQYIDFARWIRAATAESELKKQIDYWLADLQKIEPLNLPTDRPRPHVLSQKGAVEKKRIDAQTVLSLKQLALKHNCSLYMILLSVFKVVIHKYSAQTDLTIGSPYAGRDRAETEAMIGFFVNTLIIRTQIGQDETFLSLLEKVKDKTFKAFEHKDLSFERLVNELNPPRDASRYPITQTIFALQNTPYDETRWQEVLEEEFPFQAERTRYDLELHLFERDGGLNCHLIYNTDLFDEWRMKQFLRHFESVVNSVVAKPECKLSQICILSKEETELMLLDWNKTDKPFDELICIHQMLEGHAERTPGALAVNSFNGSLSYQELNHSANQLAQYLREQNVGALDVVGVCLCRSHELIMALLAVIKSGATYVPIDPEYPKDRIEFMLNDSGAKYVVTSASITDSFSFKNKIVLDQVKEILISRPKTNLDLPLDSNTSLYMIYTSGSTGRPKGSKIAHKSFVNLVSYVRDTMQITSQDRSLYYSGPAFDASSFEIWSILTMGAALFIPDPDIRLALKPLLRWVEENKITLCFFTTSMMEQVYKLEIPKCVRATSCGGDRLINYPPANFPVVYNFYGPSENTVISTACAVARTPGVFSLNPTIGRPIDNHQAYIVDKDLNHVPIGVPGELMVSGVGLAQGYHGRPELTREKFIDNPFRPGKAYMTGDLVRYLPNGEIEFFGRMDHQIQLRGYRIETGEINHVLLELAEIKDAYTMMREDLPGDQRLVSYLAIETPTVLSELETNYVDNWQVLYDREYEEANQSDLEFNIKGWNSSFTGQAIEADQMREWAQQTIERIKQYKPQDVLEIGCGTGLLLFPLHTQVNSYTASDISKNTVKNLTKFLGHSSNVKIVHSAAHHFAWLENKQSFDFAVMNSVVQYFPSGTYLTHVIQEISKRIKTGGKIFIGDVRNFDQINSFHLKIELANNQEGEVTSNLLQKVKRRTEMDKELLTAPSFFTTLKKTIPRVTHVEVKPKRGVHLTEMNMFRYDVILHLDVAPVTIHPERIQYKGESLSEIEIKIRETQTSVLLTGIHDKRNHFYLSAYEELKKLSKVTKVNSFFNELRAQHALELEELYLIGQRLGKRVELNFSSDSKSIEALFTSEVQLLSWEETDAMPSSRVLNSDPLKFERASALKLKAKEYLSQKLPEYMVPSSFMVLDELPLTANGKIDVSALPLPDRLRPESSQTFTAPTTETEKILAEIYAKCLGIEMVGILDNFFELGGHSLLAVNVVNQIEVAFGVEISLSKFFDDSKIASIALFLEKAEKSKVVQSDAAQSLSLKSLPLNSMDLNFHFARLILNNTKYAWYQVMELETAPLQVEKLKQAVLYAININPMARGRIRNANALGRDLYWDVSQHFSEAPLEIIKMNSSQEQDQLIQALSKTPLSIEDAPLCRFVLLQGPHSDRLLLRYNHGAVDGSGLQALINSLTSHYVGQADPGGRFVPFSNEELYDYYNYRPPLMLNSNEMAHIKDLFPAWLMPAKTGQAKWIRTSLLRPHKIQPALLFAKGAKGHDKTSFSVEVFMTEAETNHLKSRARDLKITVDRILMLGILTAAKFWNKDHGADYTRLEAYWAVNLRPPRFYNSTVGNQMGWSRLRVPADQDEAAWKKEILDPKSNFLVQGALDWMHVVGGLLKWPMPAWLKKWVVKIAAGTAPTLLISNTLTLSVTEVEREELPSRFGVKKMRNHSYFGSTNRPVLTIGSHEGLVKLRMTVPRNLFDESAATEYLKHTLKYILEV